MSDPVTGEKKPTQLKLNSTRLKEDGFDRTNWVATVEAGTTLEDMEQPEFWTHVCGPGNRMRRMDKIAVLVDDETWYAELIVLAVGTGFAKVRVLFHLEFGSTEEEAGEDASVFVKYRGPHLRFCVIRKSDQVCIRDSFLKKEDADRYARDHDRLMAA